MAKLSYIKDPPDVISTLNRALTSYHRELVDAGVKVCVLKAYRFGPDEEALHAVKWHGSAAAAVARKYDLKRRLQTGYDCEILVDGATWDGTGDAGRLALIDHELTHFVVLKDDNGPKMDDIGRPRLKLRPDDFLITGFVEVVERHGEYAGEAQSVKKVHEAIVRALAFAAARVATGLEVASATRAA